MLMVAIGHQAGLAIENTSLYEAKLQAERLAAVGQTIATLSHHIKNILQGIRGGSYLIDMGLNDKDDAIVRRGWGIVEKNQAKIYNLVMDMLSFSKDREPALESADLNETVGDVVELMQVAGRGAGRRPGLGARRPTCPPSRSTPTASTGRSLNIVTNAIDASEDVEGGKVAVSTAWDAESTTARVIVADNGTGHPPGRGRQDLRGLRLDQGVAGDRPRPARLAEDRPRARRGDPRSPRRSARARPSPSNCRCGSSTRCATRARTTSRCRDDGNSEAGRAIETHRPQDVRPVGLRYAVPEAARSRNPAGKIAAAGSNTSGRDEVESSRLRPRFEDPWEPKPRLRADGRSAATPFAPEAPTPRLARVNGLFPRRRFRRPRPAHVEPP